MGLGVGKAIGGEVMKLWAVRGGGGRRDGVWKGGLGLKTSLYQ